MNLRLPPGYGPGLSDRHAPLTSPALATHTGRHALKDRISPRLSVPLLLMAVLLAAFISLALVPSSRNPSINSEGSVTFHDSGGPLVLDVELADTPQEHATGLMNREFLSESEGMLFIFEGDSQRSFWMKNTLIPLDMIFINSSLDIVHIVDDARPCEASYSYGCPTYKSALPAKYVVEANSGFAENHGIEPGQRVSLNLF